MKIEKRIGAALTASALALGLFASPLESVPLSLGTTVSAQEQVAAPTLPDVHFSTDRLPDSSELEEAYINKLFYGGGFSFYKDYGKKALTGTTLEVYNELRANIEAVANGNLTSTVFSFTRTTHNSLTQATMDQLAADISTAWDYLLVDLPEDFYWFDKTKGLSSKIGDQGGTYESYTFTLNVTFYVSDDYKGADNTTVDSEKIAAAKTAVSYAQTIAAKYDGESDYDKIVGYCKEICALTEYNDAAADPATKPPYGDPWQLVWVFDQNENTTVVCEGYSKAFQYLCDLGGIECYTVTGTMSGGTGAGGHMWNVVVLDRVSYLVDITNCDDGSVGNPDKLLLKGASTSTASGCKFDDLSLTYAYDDDIIFPADILTVSTKDYEPDASIGKITISVTPGDLEMAVGDEADFTVEVTSEEEIDGYLTCTYDSSIVSVSDGTKSEDGTGTVYTVTGVAEGIATLTFEWDSDDIDLDEPCTVTCTVTVTAAECEHEYDEDDWKSDADGHWHVCKICGNKSKKEAHTMDSKNNASAPTCVNDGKKTDMECSVCGFVKEGEVLPATGVHDMKEVADTAKPATCGEAGNKADKKCEICGHIEKGAAIPATGNHTEGEPKRINQVAATCTKEGSYDEVIECTVCRKELSKEHKTIDKIPHTPSAAVRENITEATCTEKGSYEDVIKCTVCEEEISRTAVVVPAPGHDPADTWSSDDTNHWYACKNSGCTEHISEAAHVKDGGTVTTPATKDTDGVRTYSCTVCGKVLETETISALGENHVHDYTIKNSDNTSHWDECICGDKINAAAHTPASKDEIVNEANCGRSGLKYVITYCGDCGRESGRTTAVIPQTTEHNTDGADYTYGPSTHWKNCTVCGEKQDEADHTAGPAATETTPQTCTVCGYEMAPVLAHTHKFSDEWTSDDNFHWHAATCQHTGEVKDKAVHAWDGGVITTQPTETSKGVRTFTCTVCNATKTEPISELAHTHTPSDAWRFNAAGHWHACGSCDEKLNFAAHNTVSEVAVSPTVTIPGKRRYYCSICRYVVKEEAIPATGIADAEPTPTPSAPIAAPVIPTWVNGNTAVTEPILDNGSGKSGWKRIADDIKKASNGDTVYVDMNGTTTLSRIALRELAGKNVDLVLELNGDITWTVNGETVTKTSDVNMNAKLNTNNIPGKITEKLSENGKVVQVSLSHSGSFGFDAVMTVYLGTMYNGKYANLMYYNPASGAAELIDCSLITNGNASLDFTHASEYAIVISDEPMGAYEDVSAAAGAFENDITVSSAAYVSIIAAIAAAMVIFKKRTSKSK